MVTILKKINLLSTVHFCYSKYSFGLNITGQQKKFLK